jgi:hypothetical protein
VLRPGDANEVVEAYRYIMQLRHQPAVIALSRQPLPTFDRSKYASAAVHEWLQEWRSQVFEIMHPPPVTAYANQPLPKRVEDLQSVEFHKPGFLLCQAPRKVLVRNTQMPQ